MTWVVALAPAEPDDIDLPQGIDADGGWRTQSREIAAPPSPPYPAVPVPAMVLITPVVASMRRTRWLPVSEKLQIAGDVKGHSVPTLLLIRALRA